MFIVRETFTAKPGQASKLAALFKKLMAELHVTSRVMTDYIGAFNTVIIDVEAEDLAEFEKALAESGSRPEIREIMKGYTDMYVTGKREVFRVV